MLVTVNTDASYHKWFKYGGYAYWIVSNEFRFKGSGMLRKKIGRPEEAEAQSILNALAVLFSSVVDNGTISKVIINNDCQNAMTALSGDTKHLRKYKCYKQMHSYRNKMRLLLEKYGKTNLEIEFRYVKAHSDAEDSRSFVNEFCDHNAKFQMYNRVNDSREADKVYNYKIPEKYKV